VGSTRLAPLGSLGTVLREVPMPSAGVGVEAAVATGTVLGLSALGDPLLSLGYPQALPFLDFTLKTHPV